MTRVTLMISAPSDVMVGILDGLAERHNIDVFDHGSGRLEITASPPPPSETPFDKAFRLKRDGLKPYQVWSALIFTGSNPREAGELTRLVFAPTRYRDPVPDNRMSWEVANDTARQNGFDYARTVQALHRRGYSPAFARKLTLDALRLPPDPPAPVSFNSEIPY